jgi:hypothetical protein
LLERTLEEPLPAPREPELQLGRLPEFAAQGPGDDTLSRLDFEAGNVDMRAAVNRFYTPPPFRTPAEGLRAAVAPPESFDEVPPEVSAAAQSASPAGARRQGRTSRPPPNPRGGHRRSRRWRLRRADRTRGGRPLRPGCPSPAPYGYPSGRWPELPLFPRQQRQQAPLFRLDPVAAVGRKDEGSRRPSHASRR